MDKTDIIYKITLVLDEQGNLKDIQPMDPQGNKLSPVKKNMGVDWTSNGTIDNVTTVTILSKPGNSPCCATSGSGDVWCWCE